MDSWSILEEQLVAYRGVCLSIRQVLMQYEAECKGLILTIKNKSFEESQSIFDELYDIQKQLSIVVYKYEFDLSDSLRDFVYHFDRDDVYSRKYWYQRFVDGLLWPEDE